MAVIRPVNPQGYCCEFNSATTFRSAPQSFAMRLEDVRQTASTDFILPLNAYKTAVGHPIRRSSLPLILRSRQATGPLTLMAEVDADDQARRVPIRPSTSRSIAGSTGAGRKVDVGGPVGNRGGLSGSVLTYTATRFVLMKNCDVQANSMDEEPPAVSVDTPVAPSVGCVARDCPANRSSRLRHKSGS